MPPEKILFKDEVYSIQGAIFEVYREMGCGFLEAVYQECLEREFLLRGVPFRAQPELCLTYKDAVLKQYYRPDFICFDRILIELKAAKSIAPEHQAQMLNYLKAGGLPLGLIVNFGHFPNVEIERFAL
ncbi:MAG: GxxExxY protein [Planctomycetaceae bacterium]